MSQKSEKSFSSENIHNRLKIIFAFILSVSIVGLSGCGTGSNNYPKNISVPADIVETNENAKTNEVFVDLSKTGLQNNKKNSSSDISQNNSKKTTSSDSKSSNTSANLKNEKKSAAKSKLSSSAASSSLESKLSSSAASSSLESKLSSSAASSSSESINSSINPVGNQTIQPDSGNQTSIEPNNEQEYIEEQPENSQEQYTFDDGEPEYRKQLIQNKEKEPYEPIVVTTGSRVDLSWFDDCVIIGDSLANGLMLYNDSHGELGNAQFVCAACIGWVNSQYGMYQANSFHPIYNGQQVFLYDAPALTNAKKVVVIMGINDICSYGIDNAFDSADSFISRVRELTPNVEIYITTVTPMVEAAEYHLLNNPRIQSYNERLPEFARAHNCGFLDTWSEFADENGKLPPELCVDASGLGFHLNEDGNHRLCEYLISNLG